MTAPHDLAARIERADGPDRALDEMIQVFLTPDAKCMTHPGSWQVGSSFGPMRDIDWPAWNALREQRKVTRGPFYFGEPPAYTASIDAAMQLVHPATVEFEARHLLNEAINRCFRSGLPLRDNLARYVAAAAIRAQVQP